MSERPSLVYADEFGNIIDYPELEMVGSSAGKWKRVNPSEWIPLPYGSEILMLPMRLPVGYDRHRHRFRILTQDPFKGRGRVLAVAAFVAPAYTQIYSAAYYSLPDAPLLPLFAYSAVGWLNGRFVTTAIRVDPDRRQDLRGFNTLRISRSVNRLIKTERNNRLIQHLATCALSYGCPAARNFFLKRWEAPLPTSPICNAECLGCISYQKNPHLKASQSRIAFVPTVEEIAEVAIPHLKEAPKPIVSFGQGCEGEPLLQAATIAPAIRKIRLATLDGTINLNTNGSLPKEVLRLREAGLDSIRVSLNSCRPHYYNAYYRPRGYRFEDVKGSLKLMKREQGFTSINYLVLPGFTDEEAELFELCRLIEETELDLIQLRNLNIDPEWYLRAIGHKPESPAVGILNFINILKQRFPSLRFGYFNPPLR